MFIEIIKRFKINYKMKSILDLEEFAYSSKDSIKKYDVQCKAQNRCQQNQQSTPMLKKVKISPIELSIPFENRFKVLDRILQWRKDNIAPVDTMGCERLADKTAPIETMCVNRLKNYSLTPQSISNIKQDKLIELIYQCNFNKRKAKNIIQVSKIIAKDGIAKTKEALMEYPGVGVKIAMIYMNVAEDKQEGVGVDTHVHRICNKLGWVRTSNPNQTEVQLQANFPKKHWKDINIAMVGFGQLICNAKKPLCNQCPVSRLCPSSSIKW